MPKALAGQKTQMWQSSLSRKDRSEVNDDGSACLPLFGVVYLKVFIYDSTWMCPYSVEPRMTE